MTFWTNTLCAGVTAAFLVAGASLAFADDQSGENTAAKPEGAADIATPVARLDAALVIAHAGRDLNDPLLLLAAARVVGAIGATDGDGEIDSDEDLAADARAATGASEKGDEAASDDLFAELLGDARRLARGDETILALAETVEESASRGSLSGAGTYRFRVGSRSVRTIRESFAGGRTAEVSLRGDGDTDVDLHVYDQNGNLVCSDTRSSDRGYCRWRPSWTGPFTIKLTNYGRVYNRVAVWTN